MSFRGLAIAAALLALAGCGEVPKPFAHEGGNRDNPLLELRDGAGVIVAAEKGVYEGIAAPLLAGAVKALAEANVPATVNPELAGRFRLTSGVSIDIGDPGTAETAHFSWHLNDAAGKELDSFDQTITGDEPGWLDEDREILAIIAADAGQRIAGILRGEDDAKGRGKAEAGTPDPVLYVVGVDGAPGDGNVSLERALRLLVERAGGKISDSLNTATHLIMGSVEATGSEADSRLLVVSWAVTGLDGVVIGRVSQSNRVPVRLISERWGGLAYAVANGARVGIFDILARIKMRPQRRKGLINPPP